MTGRSHIALVVAVAALLVPSAALAGIQSTYAPAAAKMTGYTGSCDAKPVTFHRHRARVLIKQAYSFPLYPDKTPAKADQKRAWREHKQCIHITAVRDQISEFVDRQRARYERYWKQQHESDWCAPHPHPDGAGCWVIPAGCVESESGGSWAAANPSGAVGPYQLLGHGAPYPVSTRAQAMEHHRIAAALYASGGLGPWVAPGC